MHVSCWRHFLFAAAVLTHGCSMSCAVLQEFESSFLELLRRAHPFSRVAAKNVYNDFIADKSVAAVLAWTCWLLASCTLEQLSRLSTMAMLVAMHHRMHESVIRDAGTTST